MVKKSTGLHPLPLCNHCGVYLYITSTPIKEIKCKYYFNNETDIIKKSEYENFLFRTANMFNLRLPVNYIIKNDINFKYVVPIVYCYAYVQENNLVVKNRMGLLDEIDYKILDNFSFNNLFRYYKNEK